MKTEETVIKAEKTETGTNITVGKGKDASMEISDPRKVQLGDSIHQLKSHPVNDTNPDLKSDAKYYTVLSIEVFGNKFNKDRTGIIFEGQDPGDGKPPQAEFLYPENVKLTRKKDKETNEWYVSREAAIYWANKLTQLELDAVQEQFDLYQEVVNILKDNLSEERY